MHGVSEFRFFIATLNYPFEFLKFTDYEGSVSNDNGETVSQPYDENRVKDIYMNQIL